MLQEVMAYSSTNTEELFALISQHLQEVSNSLVNIFQKVQIFKRETSGL